MFNGRIAYRPVLYKQYEHFNGTGLKKLTSEEGILKYHMWEQEILMKMMLDQSHRTGKIIDTVTVVIDVKGMSLSINNNIYEIH